MGIFLLACIAIIVIALQFIISGKKQFPDKDATVNIDLIGVQKKTRKWISMGAGFVVLITLYFGYQSHKNLEYQFVESPKSEEIPTNRPHLNKFRRLKNP